jgi:hypothetical protein
MSLLKKKLRCDFLIKIISCVVNGKEGHLVIMSSLEDIFSI